MPDESAPTSSASEANYARGFGITECSVLKVTESIHVRQGVLEEKEEEEMKERVEELRNALMKDEKGAELMIKCKGPAHSQSDPDFGGFCNDIALRRYLIARSNNVDGAKKQIIETLEWRTLRCPHEPIATLMEPEALTGKVQLAPKKDRFGRPIIILESSKENTKDVDNQMRFLAWNLERATRRMQDGVDKFVVFINLSDFSIWTAPGMKATRETIKIVTSCFAERLGHCVLFRPPAYFTVFLASIRPFIDPKTMTKVITVRGGEDKFQPESDHDTLLSSVIGDDWKKMTGAFQPVTDKTVAAGYVHETYWPEAVKEEEAYEARLREIC